MSENNHPINEVLQTTMNKIREMVDANTVVGQPIVTQDGVTLIPVSKLSFGFATGGSDFGKAQPWCFGGGAGAGVNVMPIAFLIVKDGSVRLLPVSAGWWTWCPRCLKGLRAILTKKAQRALWSNHAHHSPPG